MSKLTILAVVASCVSVVMQAETNTNPTLHKLADVFGNEDNGIGALARLYKQVD